MSRRKVRVLALADYYLPGFQAGGPVRSLANLVERLSDACEFTIITRDRDALDRSPYVQVRAGEYCWVGDAKVLYLPPRELGLRSLRRVIRATPHDVLYLNSFFSPAFTVPALVLRRVGFIPQRPVVLAPRGEFSPSALAIKARRKRLYLAAVHVWGLNRDVTWQASTPLEEADIRRVFGASARVAVAQNLSVLPQEVGARIGREPKRAGRLRALFVSRICEKKNLEGAIRMMDSLRGTVEFDIYGPMEDPEYWRRCEETAERLPPNVSVRYRGEVAHEEVLRVMGGYELFFLPTLGENFGHVFQEALLAGCPLLVSNRTPWRDLERIGVGWDIPLDRPELFRTVLQRFVDMDATEHQTVSDRAREYGIRSGENQDLLEQNRRLFREAASATGSVADVRASSSGPGHIGLGWGYTPDEDIQR
jgi:glycosyltransferase involved in cell wall biosynthesis